MEQVLKSQISSTAQNKNHANIYASSTYSWKFHQRPLVPLEPIYLHQTVTTIPHLKPILTQTNYRESEAQTEPFTAELECINEDLVALSSLTWKNGQLPSTKSQISHINHLLSHQRNLRNLPNDPKQRYEKVEKIVGTDLRYKMSVNETMVEKRVSCVKDILERKRNDRLRSLETRLETYEHVKSEELQRQMEILEKRKEKVLAAVFEKNRYEEKANLLDKRISKFQKTLFYTDYERKSHILTRMKQQISLASEKSLDIHDMFDNEQHGYRLKNIADRLFQGRTDTSYEYQKKQKWKVQLENLAEKVLDTKSSSSSPVSRERVSMLRKREKKNTGIDIVKDAEEQEQDDNVKMKSLMEEERLKMEEHAVLIQRILRGLYDGQIMESGIEKTRDLLDELEIRRLKEKKEQEEGRSHSISNELSISLADGMNKKKMKMTEKEELKEEKDETKVETDTMMMMNEKLKNVVIGKYAGVIIDFMTKELMRKKEMEKIESIVNEARRERKRRERLEMNQRKRELEERKMVDELYSRISQVHDNTADTFISDIADDMSQVVSTSCALKDGVKIMLEYHNGSKEDDGVGESDIQVVEEMSNFMLKQVKMELDRQADEEAREKAVRDLLFVETGALM